MERLILEDARPSTETQAIKRTELAVCGKDL